MGRLSSVLMRPWTLRAFWREARLVLRLLKEPRVPLWVKATIPLGALYLVSPVDLIPDFIPGGQIDDLVLLYGAVKLFLKLSPPAAVAFHQDALARRQPYSPMPVGDDVIDAQFTRHD
jgi:uncharacterized membrane protein YkvA (DUF1232 family)